MSSESAAEREDSDEETMSFDLGPEPFNPLVQDRLPSDEYLDDLQQGLIPGGSEPNSMEYDPVTHEMPARPSLIDTMRLDMETTPTSPERAPTPPIGFSYDYMTSGHTEDSRGAHAFQPIQRSAKSTRMHDSGLARPATTFHVGPTDSNYSDEDDQALHASNGRGYPANLASSRSNRSSYPSPGQPPWERKGSWQVARAVQ